LQPSNPRRSEADAQFQLAAYLQQRGGADAAKEHFQRAQELDPENWNYHRQAWSFDPTGAGARWQIKFRALGDRPYYTPADLRPRKKKGAGTGV
jgi:tetratricopeptide (TPR) repeat protein